MLILLNILSRLLFIKEKQIQVINNHFLVNFIIPMFHIGFKSIFLFLYSIKSLSKSFSYCYMSIATDIDLIRIYHENNLNSGDL